MLTGRPSREPIVATLSFAGCVAIVAACALAALLADVEAVRNVADVLTLDGRIPALLGLGRGDARVAAALPEAAGSALAVGLVLLAFRRPIARSLTAEPGPGDADGARPAGIGRIEAATAVCVLTVFAALAARNLDLPVRWDEAHTFLRFAAGSIWTTLSDYSRPGNHVLHSLAVQAARQFLGDDPAALRLPAFLAACLTLPAVWWFVRREFGWLAAAFATTLVGTSPLFIEYAANARGYTLTCLAFMVLLLCGQGIVRRPEDHVRWGLFAAVTALGVFTNPTMVFPAAIATAWVALARWRETGVAGMRPLVVNGVVWGAAAVALTTLLYAPALMVSGADALFFNEVVQPGGASFPVVLANAPRIWIAWHAATPVWAQAALLLALLVGAMAPRRPSGHRGVLALAVVLGTGAVFLVKPVFLYPRYTTFLLLATMIVAGAGAACLVDAASARLRSKAHLRSRPGMAGRQARREGLGALAVVLVLGCFSWWATRPEVAEHFAWETGWSPNAPALAVAVHVDLRSGDYLLGGFPTLRPVVFHLRRLGRDVSKVRSASADELGLSGLRHTGRRLGMYRVGGPGSGAPARFHLVVDEAGNRSMGPPLRRRPDEHRRPQYSFRDGSPGHEPIVSLPGAKLYRLRPPPDPPAGP